MIVERQTQDRTNLAAGVERSVLAEGDHVVDALADGLGPHQCGGDAAVTDDLDAISGHARHHATCTGQVRWDRLVNAVCDAIKNGFSRGKIKWHLTRSTRNEDSKKINPVPQDRRAPASSYSLDVSTICCARDSSILNIDDHHYGSRGNFHLRRESPQERLTLVRRQVELLEALPVALQVGKHAQDIEQK